MDRPYRDYIPDDALDRWYSYEEPSSYYEVTDEYGFIRPIYDEPDWENDDDWFDD